MSGVEARGERGAALLMAVGASAVLLVLASWMLLVAVTQYEAAGYRAEQVQARLLARAVVGQARDAAAAGTLPLPVRSQVLVVVNGSSAVGRIPVALVPSLDLAGWPSVTEAPFGASSRAGLGAMLELSAVRGPRGDHRGPCLECREDALYRLDAQAWFRRARASRTATLLVRRDGSAALLD